MRAFTPENMRDADRFAIGALEIPGYVLMRRAAQCVFEELCGYTVSGADFLILCGKGNNGGDGYALGSFILDTGCKVVCADIFGTLPSSAEAKKFYNAFSEKGGNIVKGEEDIISEIGKATVIVDGIFGTGFSGDILLHSTVGRIISAANRASAYRTAIDAPSGVDALDGSIAEATFMAHKTVCLAKLKPGLYSYPAKTLCGEVVICDIGIPEEAYEKFAPEYEIGDKAYFTSLMKKRGVNTHKGTFGRLLALCGSKNMTGAAYLAASGALRSGVGLLELSADEEALNVLKVKLNEAIFTDLDDVYEAAERADSLLVGCGIGRSRASDERACELVSSFNKQIIIDADGINAISENINVLKKTEIPAIVTPHPLEFARLSGLSIAEVAANRLGSAKRFAAENHCITVLKGAATIVTDGSFSYVNTTGNSGLSKGGSGDVLAGVIASLAAQGYSALSAAIIGVYVHGLAADRLCRKYSEYGMLPSDLPEEIGRILGGI